MSISRSRKVAEPRSEPLSPMVSPERTVLPVEVEGKGLLGQETLHPLHRGMLQKLLLKLITAPFGLPQKKEVLQGHCSALQVLR